MADVTKIPTRELVEDYYASKIEKKASEKLLAGATGLSVTRLQDRVVGNTRIMAVIYKELKRRGEEHLVEKR